MMRSRDLGSALRSLRRLAAWSPAVLVLSFVLGFGSTAQAGPAPVKPTPVKPAVAKPTPKPAATATPTASPKAATTPTAAPKATADPFNAAGSTATSGAANPNVRESELYGDRLDNLQTEVDQLKDKIFRSKARLTLLKETVLRGVLSGSRVTIAHQNLMGSGFRLVKVVFIMDGAQILARTDETGSLDGEDELIVYDGNLPPGPHNVTVELTYQGNGFGVFSYLNGYTFESRSSHSFTAPENGAVKLVSQGFERGNMTTEMADRPSVNWQEVPLDASGRPLPQTRSKTRNDKAERARLDKGGK
ncbi:MAG: hypothetical protein AB1Z98_16955 [Nannocystaceae bacterium]